MNRIGRGLLWLALLLVVVMLVITGFNLAHDRAASAPPRSPRAALSRANAQARALNRLGNRLADAGDYRRAFACYRRALELAREFELRERALATVHALGILYHQRAERQQRQPESRLQDLDSAEACYRRALEMSRLLADSGAEARVLIDLGILYARSRQELTNGELLFSMALRLSQTKKAGFEQALAGYYRGLVRFSRQALDSALTDFEAARALFESLGNKSSQAQTESLIQLLEAVLDGNAPLPSAESLWRRPHPHPRPEARSD